jgi:osmotically-inducible protein OsmY
MSNETVVKAVNDQVRWDPMIDGDQIAVSVDDGVVVLRGTVGSLRQKIEAGSDAKRVHGVREVQNQLEVRLVVGEQHDDAELRARVLQALMLNSLIPSTIDAKAKDGHVTLTGTAHWHFERQEAEAIAGNVRGVRDVRSEIVLEPMASVPGIEKSIEESFQRLADVDADQLSIRSTNGTVTLSGTVSSWAQRDAAVDAAWMAPGVTKVVDNIAVLN